MRRLFVLLTSLSLLFAGAATAVAADDGDKKPAADAPQPPPPQTPGQVAAGSPVPTSPLAIHVGDADLLIGGFMDLTSITRSTNTGNGIATSFGTIPFQNTGGVPNPAGNLSETRFSAQNSRLSLQATSKWKDVNLKGYLEVDFLGNAPNGFLVTSNGNTLRMRLYWVQVTMGKFEFLAGQSWSMLTPGRNGISPVPGDIFFSQDVDTNYQMGLTWGREAGVRFLVHPNDKVTAGLSLENPEAFVGTGVVLPSAFNTSEVDQNGGTSNTPNVYPDIIGKIAFDPRGGSKGLHQHFDAAFLVRGYQSFNPATSTTYRATGSAFALTANLEPVKNTHIIGTYFNGKGNGRYISNTNIPDVIANADQSLSLVKSWSFIVGPEIQAGPKDIIYIYYSQAHADPLVGLDTDGKRQIGYGTTGNTTANNKLQETSVGLTHTFFRDAKIGGLQLMAQYAYVRRDPFSVPANTPSYAKTNMFYVNVRYLLP